MDGSTLTGCYDLSVSRLIQECWDNEASKRPTFREIISVLELTSDRIAKKMSWKVVTLPFSFNIFLYLVLKFVRRFMITNR